jgi:hypothetical protein
MAQRAPKSKLGRPSLPRGTARNIRVGISVSAAELRALREQARREGVSLSTLIRKRGVAGD